MKIDTNMYQGKPPSLEEGPLGYRIMNNDSNCNPIGANGRCNRWLQFMKVILYLELIILIGLVGCVLLPYFYMERDHGYINEYGPYDVPELIQGSISENSAIHPNSNTADDLQWSASNCNSENMIKIKEPSPEERVNERGNSFTDTEATTTPRFTEPHVADVSESMLLSKWLRTLENPWNSREESSLQSDSFWTRIMTSMEEMNDKSGPTSNEAASSTENWNKAAAIQNYFSFIHKNDDELRNIDSHDSLPLPFLRDIVWVSMDDSDETNIPERHSFEGTRLTNLRFDFQLPDLLQRHLSLQRESSSGFSENPSRSLSEENLGSAPKTKRSTESSSSVETKTPTPKVRRSTDSSSSESDSSDSSEEENDDQTRSETTEGEPDCPKILDDDGSTIDDPAEIVNHIKRNWFTWLLETPVPDCDGPNSVKTVTIDECGKFIIKCSSDESEEKSKKRKSLVSYHRDTRSLEESKMLEKCEGLVTSSRKSMEKLMETMAMEHPDQATEKLNLAIAQALMSLTIQTIAEQSLDGKNKTDEQWRDSLLEIKRKVAGPTVGEHHQQTEGNVTPNEEMVNDLRHVVETSAYMFANCQEVMGKTGGNDQGFRVMSFMIERQKCLISFEREQAREESLAAEVVTGDSSDLAVIELRRQFPRKVKLLADRIAKLEKREPATVPTGPVAITAEQWRSYMLELKRDILNATNNVDIQQRLEANGPPTQAQTDQLQAIVEYYLRMHAQCSTYNLFNLMGLLSRGAKNGNRSQRSLPQVHNDETHSIKKQWTSGVQESKRHPRNLEENDMQIKCESLVASSRQSLEQLVTDVVMGDSSDPPIAKLRHDFAQVLMEFTIRTIAEQILENENGTEQQLHDFLVDTKVYLAHIATGDYRKQLEMSPTPTQEMVNHLRNVIDLTTDIYQHCESVNDETGEGRWGITVLKFMIRRIICSIVPEKIHELEDAFAAEIVTGDASDLAVIELRQQLKEKVLLLVNVIANEEQRVAGKIPSDYSTFSDEQGQTFILELKQGLINGTENLTIRQNLETNGTPTQEQVKQLRIIMEYYLRANMECSSINIFNMMGILPNEEDSFSRATRSVSEVDDEEVNLTNKEWILRQREPVRNTRSLDENDTQEQCESLVNSTRKSVEDLMMDIVVGETSDVIIRKQRNDFAQDLMSFSIRSVAEKWFEKQKRTEEQWKSYLLKMKENIARFAIGDYRQRLQEAAEPSQKMVENLRKVVVFLEALHVECQDMKQASEISSQGFMMLTYMIRRETCLLSSQLLPEREDALAVELVKGDSSDAAIIELRQLLKNKMVLLANQIISERKRNLETTPVPPGSINDDQWLAYLLELKQGILNDTESVAIRESLEANGPPTQAQAHELEIIVSNYLVIPDECSKYNVFNLIGMLSPTPKNANKSKRSASNVYGVGHNSMIKQWTAELRKPKRNTRSLADDPLLEKCQGSVTSSRQALEHLITGVVVGNASDPVIAKLRQDFTQILAATAIHMTAEQSVGVENKTQANLQQILVNMKDYLAHLTTGDYRRELEKSIVVSEEMVNNLRNLIEATANIYDDCQDIMETTEKGKKGIMILHFLVRRNMCLIIAKHERKQEDELAAEIVTGDSSDSTVIELRQQFKNKMMSLANFVANEERNGSAIIPSGPIPITIEQWTTFLMDLKQGILNETENPVIRSSLEANGPPTMEQAIQLRTIMEYYLRVNIQCGTVNVLNMMGFLQNTVENFSRARRSVSDVEDKEVNLTHEEWILRQRKPIRDTRSLEDTDTQEQCEGSVNSTRNSIGYLMTHIVVGEPSDPVTNTLRHNFAQVLMSWTIQSLARKWLEQPDITDEQSKSSLVKMKNEIAELAGGDYRQRLEGSAEPTQEMVQNLRNVVGSLEVIVGECPDVMNATEENSRGATILGFMTRLETCLLSSATLIAKEDALAAEIVTGDSSDPVIIAVRDQFKKKMLSLANSIATEEKRDPETATRGPLSITGEQWKTYMAELKEGILNETQNAAIRQSLEASGPPTQAQTNELEMIIANYLLVPNECNKYNVFSLLDMLPRAVESDKRTRRSAHPMRMDDEAFAGNDQTRSSRKMNLNGNPDQWDMDQEMFLLKMETLSTHIDYLHEIYQKYNELNDDYVSKEFPIESAMNYQ